MAFGGQPRVLLGVPFCARAAFVLWVCREDGDQAHAYLWRRLSNCGEAQLQWVGREFQNLRNDRNVADYEMAKRFDREHAAAAVETATELVGKLKSAQSEPIKSVLTQNIRKYEREVLREETWKPRSG